VTLPLITLLRCADGPAHANEKRFCLSLAKGPQPAARPENHGRRISTACTLNRPTPVFRVVLECTKGKTNQPAGIMVHEADHPAMLSATDTENAKSNAFSTSLWRRCFSAARLLAAREYTSAVAPVHRSKEKQGAHWYLWGVRSRQCESAWGGLLRT